MTKRFITALAVAVTLMGASAYGFSAEDMQALEASKKSMDAALAAMKGDKVAADKMYADAIRDFDKVLAKSPDNVAALNGRATAKQELGDASGKADYERIISLTTQKIKSNPKDSQSLHDRARAYRGLGNYDAARKDYKEAIALNPDRINWPTDLKAMELEAKYKH